MTMKIKVEKVFDEGDETCVEFSSEYGRSSALWGDDKPTSGSFYDVEFEIDDDLVWGESISTTTRHGATIAFEEGFFVIVGEVINLEEDGCLSISVGDSVILLDVENVPENISGLVECRASYVKLYSTNL